MITVGGIQDKAESGSRAGSFIRDVRLDDAEGLREMFGRTSRDTIYYRFHIPWPEVPEWAINLLVDDTEEDRRAIVAIDGTKIVGHAMYVQDETRRFEAEVALLVEDVYQSRGVGRTLLDEISSLARQGGIETLTCTTLGSNYRLLSVLRHAYPKSRVEYGEGECLIRLPV